MFLSVTETLRLVFRPKATCSPLVSPAPTSKSAGMFVFLYGLEPGSGDYMGWPEPNSISKGLVLCRRLVSKWKVVTRTKAGRNRRSARASLRSGKSEALAYPVR